MLTINEASVCEARDSTSAIVAISCFFMAPLLGSRYSFLEWTAAWRTGDGKFYNIRSTIVGCVWILPARVYSFCP
jgi:hypothetical protein